MMPRSRALGFTLTEIALALVIVALLLGGLTAPLKLQQEARARNEATQALNDVREALLGFAAANGRLPCPAQATLASGGSQAGQEATTGTGSNLACACSSSGSDVAHQGSVACDTDLAANTVTGVLPWATLGLPELDPWGNRYTYRVTTFFARGVPQSSFGCSPGSDPALAAFALCSAGGIAVFTAASGGTSLGSGLPAIVVSHGKTGGGAYTSQGIQIVDAAATGDEQENADGDVSYVANTSIDDQLQWIPAALLMHRMLTAGKLP